MVVAGVLDAGGVVFINLGSPSLFISGTYVLLPDRSRTGLGFVSSSPISLPVLASADGSHKDSPSGFEVCLHQPHVVTTIGVG